MSHPECFGREYFDVKGGECPHEDCLLHYECRQVFSAARNLFKQSESEPEKPDIKKERGSVVIKKKRSGYVKPGRLLYVDQGTLRDKLLSSLRNYLEGCGYKTKATKCLHSFLGDDKRFLLKADTRRKNSILLYVQDNLSDLLVGEGFKCRSLFDSENPNFPPYLSWVVVMRSESDLDKFRLAFESLDGCSNDT
jgi:hypothetical protein